MTSKNMAEKDLVGLSNVINRGFTRREIDIYTGYATKKLKGHSNKRKYLDITLLNIFRLISTKKPENVINDDVAELIYKYLDEVDLTSSQLSILERLLKYDLRHEIDRILDTLKLCFDTSLNSGTVEYLYFHAYELIGGSSEYRKKMNEIISYFKKWNLTNVNTLNLVRMILCKKDYNLQLVENIIDVGLENNVSEVYYLVCDLHINLENLVFLKQHTHKGRKLILESMIHHKVPLSELNNIQYNNDDDYLEFLIKKLRKKYK